MIEIHPEVADAVSDGRPVVALETAVVTAGLPREPQHLQDTDSLPGWNPSQPVNLELARLMERTVRAGGAVPATIGVVDGRLHIGLDESLLARLGQDPTAAKAGAADLALALARRQSAGTTVSGTLAACRHVPGWRRPVMATGGIGGVHRGWTTRPDVSADLRELARARVCVVCAGPKAVLDVAATLELLETLGVAVVGYRSACLPTFYARGRPDLPIPSLENAAEIARLCRLRWELLDTDGAVLVNQPVPATWEMNSGELEAILREAEASGVTGAGVTPHLLAEVARRTGGRAVRANIALLHQNAVLAAEIAVSLVSNAAPDP